MIDEYSDKAKIYEKSRPGYSEEILDILVNYNFNKNSIIADIGSGTGKFTKLFLEKGNKTFAVEPNENMRNIANSLFHNYENYFSINGTAENTTLPNNCIDFITVAQAFHWFDKENTLKEFKRIIKNNGLLVLLWNKNNAKTIFQYEYEKIFINHIVSKNRDIISNNLSDNEIINNFGNFYKKIIIENSANNNFDEVIGGFFSSAYAPNVNTLEYKEIYNEIKDIFNKNSLNGIVKHDYNTEIYIGEIKNRSKIA